MGSGSTGSAAAQPCQLRIFTNDVGAERTLDEIKTTDVLALEAYSSPTETPHGLSGSDCATVMLWMKERKG